jgi:SAM-dependent methyltransferase
VHAQVHDFVARHADTEPDGIDVLEIGSCDVNGGVRSLFAGAAGYHGIDVVSGPGVDEVADAATWRPPQRFDVVVSTEVLEHAPRWEAVVRTAWAALRPGGRLILTCATDPRPAHSAVDGWAVRPGEHYGNVAPGALRDLLHELGAGDLELEAHRDRGDLYLWARRP